MGTPARWCSALAEIDPDVLAAALRELCEQWRPRCPGLQRIGHRREHRADPAGDRWWVHVGVVFEGEASTDTRPLEDTHRGLAQAIQRAVDLWCSAWPTLHRHARGDAALRSYHRAPEGFTLPLAPRASAAPTAAPRAAAKPAEALPVPPTPRPAPQPAAPPPEQRSLF